MVGSSSRDRPSKGQRVAVLFGNGRWYDGTVSRAGDYSGDWWVTVAFDDGGRSTVRVPDPAFKVLDSGPASKKHLKKGRDEDDGSVPSSSSARRARSPSARRKSPSSSRRKSASSSTSPSRRKSSVQSSQSPHSPRAKVLIHTPELARRIYNVCFLILLPILCSAYFGLYDLTMIDGVVFITSINYWRHPTKSYRRRIDMICVNIALVYHCFRAWHSPQSTLYWPFVVAGMGCYLKARRSKTKTEASLWHCVMHLLGDVANCMLYVALGSEAGGR